MAERFDRERALHALFGSRRWRTIAILLFGLMMLGWSVDSLYALAGFFIPPLFGLDAEVTRAILLGLVGVLALATLVIATVRRTTPPLHERVQLDAETRRPARDLILFLSNLKDEKLAEIEQSLACSHPGELPDNCPWELSLIGLGEHAETLERVLIIPSPASAEQLETFRHFVQMRPESGYASANYTLLTLPELHGVDMSRFREQGMDDRGAAPYDRIDTLFVILDLCLEHLESTESSLRTSREKGRNILVDVSGGSREVGIAGTLAALARDRRIQHISTSDKRPRQYAYHYDPDGSEG